MIDSKMPFNRALLWILVSTLLISGTAFMAWLYYLHIRERRLQDDQYRIVTIIQNAPSVDSLKTVYLAELLDLSLDRPINLYQFSAREAERKLLANPLIKSAIVKKVLPGTVYINYQMRSPLAYLGDYANTAMDEEGFLFPFRPFFTPKKLPTLYLGLEKVEYKWGNCLKDSFSLQLALTILQKFTQLKMENFRIKKLDVAQAQADSYGQREIVIVLEEIRQNKPSPAISLICLRLNPEHYAQNLMNFFNLQKVLFKQENSVYSTHSSSEQTIIDLRIPHLAFIK